MCEKNRLAGLTSREHEVLTWISSGKSNILIAKQLGISHNTVKAHVHSILRKLKVTSRAEAAIIVVTHQMNN